MPPQSAGALAWWLPRNINLNLKNMEYLQKKKSGIYRYTVQIFENRDITSFNCFRLKNYIATYTSPTDYYTLDGYEKLVVLKNKHVKALIKSTIKKEEICA